ncbi:hypothetical protein [Hymenobacter jeollabukensis]|uniref:Uncharacterized protein n=1 Tax=Hymenobacter jeollabukensis TaxID=2025313 RepID=A0A5R8WMR0_9BACT|nr:hypothetical protein [Hymenobacter jeollabukensis]TLM90538.1 hypothetical protein FDY95_17640 [Hymenobacter jeollabukensis]
MPAASPTASPAAPDTALVDQLLDFVRRTGLPVREAPVLADSFLPGLRIDNGGLVVDRRRLLYPGDILHEAGHLAVVPAAVRATLGANIADYRTPDEAQGDEIVAQLWSYAAAVALGLSPAVVFHADGYHGHSEWFTSNYQRGQYPGLPLLVWMGLTTADAFPRMTRWLRE